MRKQLTLEAYQALPWYKKPFYGILRHFSTVEDAYFARPKKWIYNVIFIVVLVGTAFDTILTPCNKLDFEQISFIVSGSSFPVP